MTPSLQSIVQALIAAALGEEVDVDRKPALDLVAAFGSDSSRTCAWTGVAKSACCERLAELVREPHQLNQAGTSYCAPAAVLYCFASRYPRRFADFGIRLVESGATRIGAIEIEMTEEIREVSISEWIAREHWGIHVFDLLAILAIMEELSFFDIEEPGDYALAPPFWDAGYIDDVRSILVDSGLFSATELPSTVAGLSSEAPPRSNVVLVGGMEVFSRKHGNRHAAVLVPPLQGNGANVTFRFWSWGTYENKNTIPVVGGRFRERTMTSASFDAGVDKALLVTAIGDDIP
jgi:hypothetical protein